MDIARPGAFRKAKQVFFPVDSHIPIQYNPAKNGRANRTKSSEPPPGLSGNQGASNPQAAAGGAPKDPTGSGQATSSLQVKVRWWNHAAIDGGNPVKYQINWYVGGPKGVPYW
jgi:hypothetical protein